MGPRARPGRKVRPPTISTMPTSSPVHSGPVVGKLPAVSGVYFFAASPPAMASMGMMMKKRPIHIATPSRPL